MSTETQTPLTDAFDAEMRAKYFAHAFGITYADALQFTRKLEQALRATQARIAALEADREHNLKLMSAALAQLEWDYGTLKKCYTNEPAIIAPLREAIDAARLTEDRAIAYEVIVRPVGPTFPEPPCQLRAELDEVTKERDELRHAAQGYELTTEALQEAFDFKALPMQCARFAAEKYQSAEAELATLRARLAEVERERDHERQKYVAMVSHLQGPRGFTIQEPGNYQFLFRIFPDASGFTFSYAKSEPQEIYPSKEWREFRDLMNNLEAATARLDAMREALEAVVDALHMDRLTDDVATTEATGIAAEIALKALAASRRDGEDLEREVKPCAQNNQMNAGQDASANAANLSASSEAKPPSASNAGATSDPLPPATWRVIDTAPRDGTPVCLAAYNAERKCWIFKHDYWRKYHPLIGGEGFSWHVPSITYWQPLPPPPAGEDSRK